MANEKDELVKLDKALTDTIKIIIEAYQREDRDERDLRRPLWLKLENYFEGLQRIYYDTVARDYRSVSDDPDSPEATNRHYDKIINVYRAHGESIVAALSVRPPSAIFYPEDADVEEDITTAKVCTAIKRNLERVNNSQLLIIKAIATLWNQGTVASYVYNRSDSKYGTYATPKYSKEGALIYTVQKNCPECGSTVDEIMFHKEKGKVDEESIECPVCGYKGQPNLEEYEEEVPEIVGSNIHPKTKTCIDVYSPLFVYIPFYARKQEHCPYLRLRFEKHYSELKNIYPRLKKKGFSPGVDQRDSEERHIQVGTNTSNLCTVDCWWFRDWALDIIDNKDDELKKLKDRYPDGMYVVVIDDQIVEVNNESLDAHWVISSNPLSTYIHGEPLGKTLAPIQEIRNEVVDLQLETFEHAIPETWARPDVVDFKKYKQSRAAPGMMYPSLPAADAGESLSSAFHTIKTAALSEESGEFLNRLDQDGQFVSSSFPSIYGGPAISGSKTAREYTESRSMALQRLSIAWGIIKYWWAATMSIAVPLNIHALRSMGEDEKVVEKNKTGFVNTWIRQADLLGKIGSIEADADENLPLTHAQLKDVTIQLMTLKDDYIQSALYHPENTPLLTKILGAPEFYIPGSNDRDKQYAEFAELLSGIAVEVNPSVDNHTIEAEVCRTFLISPTGQMVKKSNPEGWAAIEQHMIEHNEAKKIMGNELPEMEENKQDIPAPE